MAHFSGATSVYRQLGDWKKAVDDYQERIQIDPRGFWVPVGYLKDNEKIEQEKKIKELSQAIDSVSEDKGSMIICRGLAYLYLPDFKHAIADFQETASVESTKVLSKYFIGKALLSKQDYAEAVNIYSELLNDSPKQASAWLELRAQCYDRLKKWDSAIKDYGESLHLAPSASLYEQRALSYSAAGNYNQACANFSQAIAMKPFKGMYYFERGEALLKNRQFELAIKDFDKSLELEPYTIADGSRKKANAFHSLGQYGKAISNFNIALEKELVEETKPEILLERGWSQLFAGNHSEAISDFMEGLKTNPNYEEWMLNVRRMLGILALGLIIVVSIILIKKKIAAEVLGISMLALAMNGDVGDDYYTLLRFVICPLGAYTSIRFFNSKRIGWVWIFGALSVLFNPLARVQLEKGTWQVIDVIVGVLFLASIFLLRKPRVVKLMLPPSSSVQEDGNVTKDREILQV